MLHIMLYCLLLLFLSIFAGAHRRFLECPGCLIFQKPLAQHMAIRVTQFTNNCYTVHPYFI